MDTSFLSNYKSFVFIILQYGGNTIDVKKKNVAKSSIDFSLCSLVATQTEVYATFRQKNIFFKAIEVQIEVLTMTRLRRTSKVLDKSSARLQGMKSIASTLDLGNGLNVAGFETFVTETRAKLEAYQQYLSLLDEKLIELREAEKGLAIISKRMMAGIEAKFGNDSVEYAQAGGVRKSDRKRPGRKTTTKNISSPTSWRAKK